jgi:hypothetical protein
MKITFQIGPMIALWVRIVRDFGGRLARRSKRRSRRTWNDLIAIRHGGLALLWATPGRQRDVQTQGQFRSASRYLLCLLLRPAEVSAKQKKKVEDMSGGRVLPSRKPRDRAVRRDLHRSKLPVSLDPDSWNRQAMAYAGPCICNYGDGRAARVTAIAICPMLSARKAPDSRFWCYS